MKHTRLLTTALAAVLLLALQPFSPLAFSQADASGISLGLQAYTFRDRTFAETVDRAAAMGIKYIQAFPKQKISPTNPAPTDHNMDAASKAEVRALLAAKNITLTSYGVIIGKNETEWRKIFDFAKEMGLRDIATEPKPEFFPLVAKLSAQTGVAVTIHNHPTPNPYADPATVLAAIKPYGKNIGFCADTGHWARSGFDPVATLKKYLPNIISLHIKDLSERNVRTAHDMPWGTGASSIALQVAELRRQNFNGIVYMEYEYMNPRPRLDAETAASADWFQRALAAPLDDLVAGRVPPAGYTTEKNITQIWSDKQRNATSARWASAKPLLAPDLANATYKPGTWEYENGVLTAKGIPGAAPGSKSWQNGAANLWTNETYGDFVLNLDFLCATKTNSGILLRVGDIANWLHTGIEVQILQGNAANDKTLVGAIYDIAAPSRQIEIEPGRWYHLAITAKGQALQVSIDGEELTTVDLAQWTQAGQNPDGTKNKFKTAYSEMPKKGRIGLQYHGTPISFRNLVIERLD